MGLNNTFHSTPELATFMNYDEFNNNSLFKQVAVDNGPIDLIAYLGDGDIYNGAPSLLNFDNIQFIYDWINVDPDLIT